MRYLETSMINNTYQDHLLDSKAPRGRSVAEIVVQLYAKSLKALLQKDAQSEIVFLGQGSGISRQQMTHLQEFRNKQLLHQKPWLLRGQFGTSAEENFADRLSYHLMALKKNRIYGVLRITPYAFNFHRYTNFSPEALKGKEKYVEFDKFVSLNTDQKLNQRIVNMAAAFSVLELDSRGVVAMTNSQKKNKYLKLGMKDSGVEAKIEGQNYSLVHSSFKSLFQSHLQNLVVR
jgi:hypothetical protein